MLIRLETLDAELAKPEPNWATTPAPSSCLPLNRGRNPWAEAKSCTRSAPPVAQASPPRVRTPLQPLASIGCTSHPSRSGKTNQKSGKLKAAKKSRNDENRKQKSKKRCAKL